MEDELIIEPAEHDDADAILNIQKSAFYSQALLYSDFSLPPLTETKRDLLAAFDDHTILKANKNGRVIGAVRGREKNGTCHISRLVVAPDFQDKGVGSRLMQVIESHFPGVERFELFTGFKSAKSLYLYNKLGYVKCREMWENDNLLLVVLEKRLPPTQK